VKFILTGITILATVAIFALAGVGFDTMKKSQQEFLRLHVRANSNSQADQAAKQLIRQSVVNELTPILYDVKDKQEAMYRLRDNLGRIQTVADSVLQKSGFTYTAHVGIKSEFFPTRSYTTADANLTLPEGLYDALILELGEGAGDNWWCVVYPPLCFLENNIGGKDGIHYRSKILEWLK
jgi:stage II sporulation protein R